MLAPPGSCNCIVLAGERPGGSALSRACGVPSGVLVNVAGQPALTRVLTALRASESVSGGYVCGPEASIQIASTELSALYAPGDYVWLAPSTGPAASALAALREQPQRPSLVTTGDHALLTAALVDEFCRRAAGSEADFIVGLVPYDTVRAEYPSSKRTVLRFADREFCGSNLFYVRTSAGERAVEFWREMEAHRKTPWKIAARLGPGVMALYLARRLTASEAFQRLADRAGCTIDYLALDIARAAVDVDSLADLALANLILSREEAAA